MARYREINEAAPRRNEQTHLIEDTLGQLSGINCTNRRDEQPIPMRLLHRLRERHLERGGTRPRLQIADSPRRDVEEIHAVLSEDGREPHGVLRAPRLRRGEHILEQVGPGDAIRTKTLSDVADINE